MGSSTSSTRTHPASTYKLHYFPVRWRAEAIRWLFEYAGIQYEDMRLSGDEWQEFQSKTPFGQLPVLEVDGVMIAQSNVIASFVAERAGLAGQTDLENARLKMIADCMEDSTQPIGAILAAKNDSDKEELKKKWTEKQLPTYLAYLERFLKDNKTGFFVGNKITWVDLKLPNILSIYSAIGEFSLDKYPLIRALEERVTSHPKIADWIKRRPVTER